MESLTVCDGATATSDSHRKAEGFARGPRHKRPPNRPHAPREDERNQAAVQSLLWAPSGIGGWAHGSRPLQRIQCTMSRFIVSLTPRADTVSIKLRNDESVPLRCTVARSHTRSADSAYREQRLFELSSTSGPFATSALSRGGRMHCSCLASHTLHLTNITPNRRCHCVTSQHVAAAHVAPTANLTHALLPTLPSGRCFALTPQPKGMSIGSSGQPRWSRGRAGTVRGCRKAETSCLHSVLAAVHTVSHDLGCRPVDANTVLSQIDRVLLRRTRYGRYQTARSTHKAN